MSKLVAGVVHMLLGEILLWQQVWLLKSNANWCVQPRISRVRSLSMDLSYELH